MFNNKLNHKINVSFYNPLPSKFLLLRNSRLSIYFNISDVFNTEIIKSRILSKNLDLGFYLIFVKIRYSGDQFRMLGPQFGFEYHPNVDFNISISSIIIDKLSMYFDEYGIGDEDVHYVELLFYKVSSRFLKEYQVDSYYLPKSGVKIINNMLNVPISINLG